MTMAVSIMASASPSDTLSFILMSDIHIESDFMERGKPCYTQWAPGNHAALRQTFRFINDDSECSKAEFILSLGDQLNTGYTREQEQLDAEYRIYKKLIGKLRLSHRQDMSSFKMTAPSEYLCRENLGKGQTPITFHSPELKSRIIAIQGNHDTGVPQFFRNCAFQCQGVRFICFFASYVGLPAPPGKYRSTAKISDETMDFVSDELKKASADPEIKDIVLACHWSICTDSDKFCWPILDACKENGMSDNRAKLLSLAQKYGCRLYLNGHEHTFGYPYSPVGKMVDVNGSSVAEGQWALVEMTGDKVVFNIYSTAKASHTPDGKVEITSLPEKTGTVTVILKDF